LIQRKDHKESDFRLPTEAQWEYAARGGRSQTMFPWGNYYLRNKKGCLMANFKPGRGNYSWKMVASIPYVQMLTGLMIMGCTVCQVMWLNGPHQFFMKVATIFSMI